MRDLMGMLGKAKEMQAKFQAMQEEMTNMEVEGQSAAGAVKVTLSGKFEMRKLSIEPSLLKADEAEILEDLILAAHNDARVKIESEMQRKTQEMTAGLPIPSGFKLPF
jgi:DNA-binding YbaB/EbfC family protein